MTDKTPEALRARVEELMQAGTSADLAKLDTIYHEDIVMMDLSDEGQLLTLEKEGFMGLLEQTFKDEEPGAHMWAKFHRVHVDGEKGHVLISRKIPVGGPERMIDLSIDWVYEDGRWQVIREVNYSRPAAQAA